MASLASLVAVLALAGAATAQTPPRHTDHDQAEPSEAALVAAAQGMVDAGANGLEASLEGAEMEPAIEQADRSEQLGAFLQEAAATQTRNVSLEPVLERLGPAGVHVGPALANLTHDGYRLFHANASGSFELALAWTNAHRDIATAQARLDALAAEGVETQRLAQLLAAYEERLAQTPPPAEAGVRIDPDPAYLGHELEVLIVDPDHARANASLAAFEAERNLTLDARGVAETQLLVPWTAEPGTHPVNLSWPNATVEASVEVERVPTAWENVRAGPPGEGRALRATLVDHREHPVPAAGATVQLAAFEDRANLPADDASTTAGVRAVDVRTDADGRLRVPLLPSQGAAALAFEGNRTHQPVEHVWEDPWEGAPAQAETPEDEGPTLQELFERVGVSQPPEAPAERWALAWTLVVAVLVVAALEVQHLAWRDPAHRPWPSLGLLPTSPVEPAPDAQAAAAAGGGFLPEAHPVRRALTRAGYDPSRLTLRQAAEILEGMGAPDVQLWAVQHERAYYGDDVSLPVPEELRAWAEELP